MSILCLDGMRGPIWHYFQDDDVPNALSHLLLNASAWSLLELAYLCWQKRALLGNLPYLLPLASFCHFEDDDVNFPFGGMIVP